MTYNIHPIFVHFPIALLFVYSLIKIIPFKKWFPGVSWRHAERILLFFGTLGAFAALYTGEIAEHLFKPARNLVEAHSTFAAISSWIYGVLLFGEILSIFNASSLFIKINSPEFKKILIWKEKILTNEVFSRILAFLGLIAISVTGLLGGVMVYGLSADPVAGMVLKILGINY